MTLPLDIGSLVEVFVNKACPEMPPSPPGWDEWWAKHRDDTAKAIIEAQDSRARAIEFRYLKTLEAYGLLGVAAQGEGSVTVPLAFLRRVGELLFVPEPKNEPEWPEDER